MRNQRRPFDPSVYLDTISMSRGLPDLSFGIDINDIEHCWNWVRAYVDATRITRPLIW